MIHMKAGIAIVHEHRRSCQVDHGQVSTPSGVITAGCGVPSGGIVTYITPLDCHTVAARPVARPASRTAETGSAAALVHPVWDFIDNSVGGVLEGAVPCGGTRSEVVARRAGGLGSIGARRTLSTGRLVQAQRVDEESRVLPAQGGVRFDVYTGPMKMMTSVLAVSAAVVTAVGR